MKSLRLCWFFYHIPGQLGNLAAAANNERAARFLAGGQLVVVVERIPAERSNQECEYRDARPECQRRNADLRLPEFFKVRQQVVHQDQSANRPRG